MTSDNPTARKGRPRTLDPAHVLEVAMNAYWRDDPADVSVNAVCRLAGVSKPSLYREFGSEDGLTCAALDSYAEQVLADVIAILQAGRGLRRTLDALIVFACEDDRMETGCLFYKMRSGKHRLGRQTRERVEELDAMAHTAYETFLRSCPETDDWTGAPSVKARARYLSSQVALAISQRASGECIAQVRESLSLALSVFTR